MFRKMRNKESHRCKECMISFLAGLPKGGLRLILKKEGQAEMAGNELDMQTFVKYAMVISEVILVSE